MAICEECEQEMDTASDCSANREVEYADGTTLPAIPYHDDDGQRCHDCNVEPGNYHHLGCDSEHCPKCHGQIVACSCEFAEEDEDEE